MDEKYVLGILVAIVMGWFAAGMIYNLRRGDAMLRWLRQGLPRIGERTSFRWLGTSVAQLVISKAYSPLRTLETLLVMAPRDVPWFWLIAASRGRRDTMILRAQLAAPPRIDLELADPHSWTGRRALQDCTAAGWEGQPYGSMQLMAQPGMLNLAVQALRRLEAPVGKLAPRYYRLALRRNEPHLELHLPFPNRNECPADAFFDDFKAVARTAGEALR